MKDILKNLFFMSKHSRVFKNIETLYKRFKILKYNLLITISGNENIYKISKVTLFKNR